MKPKKVEVQFLSTNRKYYYLTHLVLKTGDFVICDSKGGLGIAMVTGVNTKVSGGSSWILCTIDPQKARNSINKFIRGE